jgi:hypothetical protein
MSFANYRIVKKSFTADRLMRCGEVVNISEWRNARNLESAGYIRQPNSEADYALIQEVIKKAGAVENAAPVVSDDELKQLVQEYAQQGLKAKEISEKLKADHSIEIYYMQVGKILKESGGDG